MSFPVYKQHELSALFPEMTDEEVDALADDIKQNGLREPIVLYKGKILDGMHRYYGCRIAGIIPRTVEYKGEHPEAFVKSKNWHRRHLTASQRGVLVTKMNEWVSHGGNRGGKPSFDGLKTVAEMADEAGVSAKTIERSKVVVEKGGKALQDAVRDGKITVDKAEKIARAPKREQKSLIMAPPPDAPSYTKEDALEDEIKELRSALALKHTPDDEKVTAKELIDDLNGKIKVLEVKLRAVTLSRDTLQNENAELKRQITRQRKEIDKLAGTRTA